MNTRELVKKWAGTEFQSSTARTPQFNNFAKDFKNAILADLKELGLELADFYTGHFYVSGFIKKPDSARLIYFSISDVRFFKYGWTTNVLYRTAKDLKDYSGGVNKYCELVFLAESARALLD